MTTTCRVSRPVVDNSHVVFIIYPYISHERSTHSISFCFGAFLETISWDSWDPSLIGKMVMNWWTMINRWSLGEFAPKFSENGVVCFSAVSHHYVSHHYHQLKIDKNRLFFITYKYDFLRLHRLTKWPLPAGQTGCFTCQGCQGPGDGKHYGTVKVVNAEKGGDSGELGTTQRIFDTHFIYCNFI